MAPRQLPAALIIACAPPPSGEPARPPPGEPERHLLQEAPLLRSRDDPPALQGLTTSPTTAAACPSPSPSVRRSMNPWLWCAMLMLGGRLHPRLPVHLHGKGHGRPDAHGAALPQPDGAGQAHLGGKHRAGGAEAGERSRGARSWGQASVGATMGLQRAKLRAGLMTDGTSAE